MTGIYWHASHARPIALSVAMGVSLLALLASELAHVPRQAPHAQEKLAAARLCERAFDVLREERQRRGLPVDASTDPTQSGLIGSLLTPITTDAGKLTAKQTTINVNFAAVVVDLLFRADVKPGDTVAISMTGSFPAFDVAVLSASATLNLRPLVIVSGASSQWGANEPAFSWIDMLRTLNARGVFAVTPIAASRGGIDDVARGMPAAGQELLDRAIAALDVPKLAPHGAEEGVEQRLAYLQRHAAGQRIAAYINIGGGIFSVGSSVGKHTFQPGINRSQPEGMPMVHSVMQHFLNEGVPVINMLQAETLAHEYGLPIAPQVRQPVGVGQVYARPVYSRTLAAGGIVAIVLTMLACFRRRA